MTLFEITIKGGPIMIVLFVLSLVSTYIIIEKFIRLSRVKKQDRNFIVEFKNSIEENNIEKALKICSLMRNIPLANIIYESLNNFQKGSDNLKEFIASSIDLQVNKLETKLGLLSTISSISPLIGFLGTVTGMIKVFMKIQQTGGGVDISLLAGGIWEALITTVGGLVVGIVSLIFYNLLIDKTQEMATGMAKTSHDFILMMSSKE